MLIIMIKITMNNGFYYKGEIVDEDEDFITIKDVTGKIVEIRKTNISVKEVEENG